MDTCRCLGRTHLLLRSVSPAGSSDTVERIHGVKLTRVKIPFSTIFPLKIGIYPSPSPEPQILDLPDFGFGPVLGGTRGGRGYGPVAPHRGGLGLKSTHFECISALRSPYKAFSDAKSRRRRENFELFGCINEDF